MASALDDTSSASSGAARLLLSGTLARGYRTELFASHLDGRGTSVAVTLIRTSQLYAWKGPSLLIVDLMDVHTPAVRRSGRAAAVAAALAVGIGAAAAARHLTTTKSN